MTKQNIAILCGGQSVEHDVSLMSASNVIRDLDEARFNKVIIYIARDGKWLLADDVQNFISQAQQMKIDSDNFPQLLLQPGDAGHPIVNMRTGTPIAIDCVFPVLHGALGEDGTMQGLLQMLNVPFVGCDAISSGVCMEKHINKQLLRHANIPTLDWISLHRSEKGLFTWDQVVEQLAPTVFIKTVSSGSSIGVYKVRNEDEYQAALDVIFDYDDNIIIETGVNARELEISVLGNHEVVTTPPGEVLVYADFYTYEAKYFDDKASEVVTPANVSEALSLRLQELAVKAFRALRCKGMARIDFLAVSDEEVYLNEVNPLPGFTNISMYPKNWAAAGLDYTALLSKLVETALQAHVAREHIRLGVERFVTQKREEQSAV
jgi:D-alanine-D-alanine ligase